MFERVQTCLYFAIGVFGCFSWKCAFIKYRQTAGSDFEHSSQRIGTLEHGKDEVDVAAMP